ncbi:25031_t:CDS:1, partial [Gigaspora rosea]
MNKSHIVVNNKEMVDLERQKDEIMQIELNNNNYFCSGWALKENQEYGKKGRGKCMTETVKEILKPLFHAGNEDKNERYTAKEMLQDLQQRVQTGELEADKIPQLKTIENWIGRYSSLYKKEVAKEAKAAVLSQKISNKLFLV